MYVYVYLYGIVYEYVYVYEYVWVCVYLCIMYQCISISVSVYQCISTCVSIGVSVYQYECIMYQHKYLCISISVSVSLHVSIFLYLYSTSFPLLTPPQGTTPTTTSTSSRPSDLARHSRWLANVEISTHSPPDRPLWQGRQFIFKTLSSPNSAADAFQSTEIEMPTAEAVQATSHGGNINSIGGNISGSDGENINDGRVGDDIKSALESNDAYIAPRGRIEPDVTEDDEFDDALLVSGDVPTAEMPHVAGQWGHVAGGQWGHVGVTSLADLNRALATLGSTALAAGVAAAERVTAAANGGHVAQYGGHVGQYGGHVGQYVVKMPSDEVTDVADDAEGNGGNRNGFHSDFEDDIPVTMWSPDGDNEVDSPLESPTAFD